MYKNKDPGNDHHVAGLPGSKSGTWTKGQKVPYFREVLRKKCTRKKIPEIAIVLSFCPTF
jgi:hypothetical protein